MARASSWRQMSLQSFACQGMIYHSHPNEQQLNIIIFNLLKQSSREYPISETDRALIKSAWKVARKNGNIAPKAFIRYFRLRPEKQQAFPAFANVALADLPTNSHFLNQAYTCLAGLNTYIDYLGKSPKDCPHLNSKFFRSVPPADIQQFGEILFSVMEEELAQSFSADAKTAWKNAMKSCASAFGKH